MTDSPRETSHTLAKRGLNEHVRVMPGWQKGALVLAVLCGLVGGVYQAYVHFTKPRTVTTTVVATRPASASDAPADGSGRSSFLGDNRSGRAEVITTTVEKQREPTTTETASQWMTRIGGSLVLGFIVGFIFRMFVKTMTMLTILVVGGIMALKYFNILNVDTQAVEERGRTFLEWLTREGDLFKDAVVKHIPSAGSGLVGTWIGFRRK